MEYTFVTKKEAQAVLAAWRNRPRRIVRLDRKIAISLTSAFLRAHGYYADSASVWVPKPDIDSRSRVADAPLPFSFPLGKGLQRWLISATRICAQHKVSRKPRTVYTKTSSESLYDFAAMLLTDSAQMLGKEDDQEVGERYERRLAVSRSTPPSQLSPSRVRQTQCIAEAWRRMFAGNPGPEGGQDRPAEWLPRLLWSLGWSDKWRFLEGDSYLTEPASYVFSGGPAKQAYWYQTAEGQIISGFSLEGATTVEILSQECLPKAARVHATVTISKVTPADPRPVLQGVLSCTRTGALRGSEINRRLERDPLAEEAWKKLIEHYRGRA